MIFLLVILSILWLIRTTKIALFYIYFWQLKEYQVKRFLDHFATAKGKQLIFNGLNFVKFVLIVVFFFRPTVFFYLLLALYLTETLKAFLDILQKRLKKPVLTKKTAVLIPAAIFLEILFLLAIFLYFENIYWLAFGFLIFDILSPIIFSLTVLAFQPLTVLLRNQIIKKAKKKREQFSAPKGPASPAKRGERDLARGGKDLLVIGITGSYGKTSAKEFLATILSEKFKVLKTKAHQNSEIGISQCILNDLKKEHEIFIVEMGAYGRGGIKLLCGIVKPKIGILTGINEQHLALYGSQKNIIKTKYELIESLPTDGTAIFNGANKYCSELYNKKTEIRKKLCNGNLERTVISAILDPDIWAEDIKIEKEWISFKVCLKKGEAVNFRVNLIGRQNIENILLAVCCAKELGMSLKEISRACLRIKPEQGGTKFLRKNGLTILDTSYSATPMGIIADLDYLKIYSGKKIIVMPCLIELGEASKKAHRKIGKKIGEVCDLAIITTKERFKEIKEGAAEGKMENVLFIKDSKKIIEKIGSEGVALLEGRVPKKIIELLKEL